MKTKIKSDSKGLYVRCGGWIGRPCDIKHGASYNPAETKYKLGDEVKASHPAGPYIYVADIDKRITRDTCEIWFTEDTYWWHPIEGSGKEAKQLREHDVKRYPTLYKKKQKDFQEFSIIV